MFTYLSSRLPEKNGREILRNIDREKRLIPLREIVRYYVILKSQNFHKLYKSDIFTIIVKLIKSISINYMENLSDTTISISEIKKKIDTFY